MKITKSINKAVRIVVLLLLMFTTNKVAWGQTTTFTGSGNWTDAFRWSLGVPNTGTSAIINGVATVNTTVIASNLVVNGTINLNSGGNIASIGTITIIGTYNHNIDGGTIPAATWNAASNCNITAVTTTLPSGLGQAGLGFGNLTWSSPQTGPIVLNQNITVQGTTSINNTGGQSLLLATSGNFTITTNHFIMNPASGVTAKFLLANGPRTGILDIKGDFQNIPTPAGTVLLGDAAVSGPYSNQIDFTGNSLQMANVPNYVGAGTSLVFNVNGAGNTVVFKRTNFVSSVPLELNILNGTFSLEGTPTVQILSINTFSGSGTLKMVGAAHRLNIGGTVTFNGTLTTDTNASTINYNGSTQNVFASPNYQNVDISGATSTKTLSGNIACNNLVISSANTLNTSNFNINIKGSLINDGVFTAGTGTVIFNGASAQTIGGTPTTFITTFNNLTINRPSATGDVVMNHGITVAGTLTLSGGKLVTGIYELQLTNTNFVTQLTGGNSSNYIVTSPNGKFSRNNVNNPSAPVLFPIGMATSYTPLNITNVGGSASVSVRDEATLPATPSLSSVNKVKLIWNISTSNNASTILFNWNLGDETGILTLALAKIHQLNANWVPISATTTTLPTTRTASATISQNGDFAVFNAPCPTLTFTNIIGVNATINTLYSFSAGITGNTGTVSYSVLPTLPAGLSLDTTTGIISGTPTALSSANSYTVTATQVGCTGFSQLYTFGVVAAPIPLATPRTDIKFVPTPNKIVFSWLAVANATAYEVRKATTFKADGTFDWGTSRNVGNVIVLSDDIIYDVVTYYSVRAIGTVNSGWSTTVSIFISSVNDPATALNANINTQIILLPNPATDNFIIDNANANTVFKENNIAFTLMDMTGKTILIENTTQGLPYKMNLDKVVKGLYFVKITTKENAVIKKIVKE